MSIENRVEATAKNVEGKIQEVVGEVTEILRIRLKAKLSRLRLS